MPFGTGFITGLAKSVDRSIRDDMDELKEQTSMLSKLRYERGMREHERYNEDMQNNLEVIKDMSRKVGSTDNVQFLIDRYGYAEAQNVANLLYDRKNKSGGLFDINNALGLEKRQGDSVSSKQLAEFVTTPYTLSKQINFGSEDNLGDDMPGLMKMFGVDRGVMNASVIAKSNKLLSAAGVPTDMKTSLTEMPETLKGKGIREWELYTLDNPAADARRLMSLSQQMYTKAKESGNESLLNEAHEVRSAAENRLFEAQSLENIGSRYNDVDVTRSMSNMTAQLAAANGVGDKGSYQGGVYTTGGMASEQANTLTETAGYLTEIGSEARSKGVNPVDIAVAQQKAIRENRTLIFNPSDEKFVRGGTFTFGEEGSLIENQATLFPTTAGLGGTNVTITQTQGQGNQGATSSVQNLTIANAQAAYNGAKTGADRKLIQTNLQNLLQKTPYNFSPSVSVDEAKRLLGI